MLYTGGTTGMPKGVMWRRDDNTRNIIALGTNPRYGEDPVDYQVTRDLVTGPGMVSVPTCPLMHGTGCMTQLIALSGGGCVVTLKGRTLDTGELFDTVERHKGNTTAIVGDAFASPVLRALDAEPDRWDLSSLYVFTSSGVMFSRASKDGLLRHVPHAMIVDTFSSSEAVGMGQSVTSASGGAGTAKFTVGAHTKVFTEDLREVEPGSGETGRVAVEADGSITLLGRGAVCINTSGEKVFPEEVEAVLKTHPDVRDAVAVGVPDDKFAEAITAVVELAPDTTLYEAAVVAHVKAHLASYKAPKPVLTVATIGRAPNGNVDYKRIENYASDTVDTTGSASR